MKSMWRVVPILLLAGCTYHPIPPSPLVVEQQACYRFAGDLYGAYDNCLADAYDRAGDHANAGISRGMASITASIGHYIDMSNEVHANDPGRVSYPVYNPISGKWHVGWKYQD
jgi:hypothetical protein